MENTEVKRIEPTFPRQYDSELGTENLLRELSKDPHDVVCITEQGVFRVPSLDFKIFVPGLAECSCDIFISDENVLNISHTMPPYENISISKLSRVLSGKQKVITIGMQNTDSETYRNTEKYITSKLPNILLTGVYKIELDTDGFPFDLVIDKKRKVIIYSYFNENTSKTIVNEMKIDLP